MSEYKVKSLHMGPARCAVDLGDGSERGEYVDQDYILQKLGRPHRAINLMYCYYPNDEGWPGRASVVHADPSVQFAWDFPYDDYFTYKGGIGGTLDDEPFTCMRDVRRHGQDVLLTLTIDPKLTDDHIVAIAKDLSTFGRVQLRINHEATGNWFSFNKRADYPEVAAFFAHCCEIIHREAPNVKVIICLDGCKELEDEKIELKDSRCIILGAGGAATSILVQAALDGVREISVFCRPGKSTEHARQVINQLAKQTACKINLFDYSDESVIKKELLTSRILTNGTNVGMAPDADRSLITSADFFHPDLIVSDVIYNPRETKLMEIAKSQGCSCFNGLYMLLYQGAEAFTLWTGEQMPVELVKERYFDEPEARPRTAQ